MSLNSQRVDGILGTNSSENSLRTLGEKQIRKDCSPYDRNENFVPLISVHFGFLAIVGCISHIPIPYISMRRKSIRQQTCILLVGGASVWYSKSLVIVLEVPGQGVTKTLINIVSLLFAKPRCLFISSALSKYLDPSTCPRVTYCWNFWLPSLAAKRADAILTSSHTTTTFIFTDDHLTRISHVTFLLAIFISALHGCPYSSLFRY